MRTRPKKQELHLLRLLATKASHFPLDGQKNGVPNSANSCVIVTFMLFCASDMGVIGFSAGSIAGGQPGDEASNFPSDAQMFHISLVSR